MTKLKLQPGKITGPAITLKPECEQEVVGFNGSGAPLGQRQDLHILAELALTVNPGLKRYFATLPTLAELQELKNQNFLAATEHLVAAAENK